MVRKEPMLISASFFWSNAINAFLFGHGPMTPTLLHVMMLTGLNITAPDCSFDFLDKASFKIETRTIGGWKGYITKNMKTGSVSLREHTTFLNMWLEKFIFCGKTVGPTNNTLKMAETLASGNPVPLVNIFLDQFIIYFTKYRPNLGPTNQSLIWGAHGGS